MRTLVSTDPTSDIYNEDFDDDMDMSHDQRTQQNGINKMNEWLGHLLACTPYMHQDLFLPLDGAQCGSDTQLGMACVMYLHRIVQICVPGLRDIGYEAILNELQVFIDDASPCQCLDILEQVMWFFQNEYV